MVRDRSGAPWFFPWRLAGGDRREVRRSRREARQDAALMIPDDHDQIAPPAIQELRSRGQELADRIALRWQRQDEAAHLRYAECYHALKGAREAEIPPTRAEEGARTRYAEVRAHAAEVHERLNPPGARWYCSGSFYYIAVAILAALDVPLTAIAFETFGMDPLRTNLVAVLVVLLLTVIGHFVGHGLRRVRWGDGTVLLLLLLLISGGYIVGLGFAREQSITAVMLGEPVLNHFWDVWLFIAVTTMGLVVPALLARHERDEPLAGAVRAARREWRLGRRDLDRALWRSNAEAARLRRAIVRRQTARDSACREADLVRTRTRICMQAYVVTNVRTREGNLTPPGLREEALPAVSRPEPLSAMLAWDPPPAAAEVLLDGALPALHARKELH